ncbi:MAG: transposase [Candidatus Vogelbacteria bacterium]|nr:transposase [Candidatus Vogelbacteria bacterium]
MERKFEFSIDEYYHVYNRGTDRRLIFVDDVDREHFIKLLYLCNGSRRVELRLLPKEQSPFTWDHGETLVDIGSYCLMPNHFHLLLHEKTEGGISKFMLKLVTAYVMFFNRRHKRSGTLFEGNFKAIHANDEHYLEYLFAYIHLNPIKLLQPDWKDVGINNLTNAKHFLESYTFSSYIDYIGNTRDQAGILNRKAFPDYFDNVNNFSDFHDEWLQYGSEYEIYGREKITT